MPIEELFTVAFYIVFGALVGMTISLRLFPLWWFWLSFLGALVGFGAGSLKFELRKLEVLEIALVSLITWLAFVFLSFAFAKSNPLYLVGGILLISFYPLFLFLDRNYTRISWYKSGKVGFAGIAAAGLFFLIRSVVALFLPNVLSFVGHIDAIISAIASFSFFLIIYNLSRKDL